MKDILKKIVLPIASIIAIIVLDQWTKFLTVTKLGNLQGASLSETFTTPLEKIATVKTFPIIDKVFVLTFVQNQGMAWGLFQNFQAVFIIATVLVVAVLVFLYYRAPFTKKFILFRVFDIFLIGGALGNAIDRMFRGGSLFHGYVVDMFYAEIINFPVFNIADSFVTVGFAILIISMFFVYNESDLDLVFGIKSKKENGKEEPKEEKENENN